MINVQAQEVADSLESTNKQQNESNNSKDKNSESTKIRELDEVVVEGKSIRVNRGGMSVTPSRTQTQAATDGVDLLRRLGMSAISVDPASDNVTTLAGQPISFFIDSKHASKQDIENINLKNVLTVEYLEFPSDARYHGAQYVINYVMKPVIWGGYTRLAASYSEIAKNNFSPSVYAQFTREKLTYDFYAGYTYDNQHHFGLENFAYFHLLNKDGNSVVQPRIEKTTYSRSRDYSLPVTARVMYNTDKISIINKVGFTFSRNPVSFRSGQLWFNSSDTDDYEYSTGNENTSRTMSWEGRYFFKFPKQFSLDINTALSYSNLSGGSNYSTSVPDNEPIINLTNEHAISTGINVYLSRLFRNRYNVAFSGNLSHAHNHVDYAGTSPYVNRFTNWGGNVALLLSAYWDKFSLDARAGFDWLHNNVNSISNTTATSPEFILYAAYAFNSQHRLSANLRYNISNPGSSDRSPNIIKVNEFLYYTGNPYLKPRKIMYANLTYLWILSRKVNLSYTAYWTRVNNNSGSEFTWFDNGSALLKSELNSGYCMGVINVINCSYKPLPQFELQAALKYWHSSI